MRDRYVHIIGHFGSGIGVQFGSRLNNYLFVLLLSASSIYSASASTYASASASAFTSSSSSST